MGGGKKEVRVLEVQVNLEAFSVEVLKKLANYECQTHRFNKCLDALPARSYKESELSGVGACNNAPLIIKFN